MAFVAVCFACVKLCVPSNAFFVDVTCVAIWLIALASIFGLLVALMTPLALSTALL
ncbi:Uncharacterised protein [Staphylococcus aureus]|nr:Uncharacterised protein [Staphylococcus aureus]